MISYKEALQEATESLESAHIADARIDAVYLLEYLSGRKRLDFILHGDNIIEHEIYNKYRELTARRASHVPLQHLIGSQEFMGLKFHVNEHVLIPRQDTEVLVEEVLKVCEDKTVLDMCTGSGCIIISISVLGNVKDAVGVDFSKEALKVAQNNARSNNTNITFIHSDMFQNLTKTYDIIVSNPPYIRTEEINHLMPEVREHEPHMALDGDEDGLKFYRIIAKHAGDYLNDGGYLFLEIGYDQGKEVSDLLESHGFDNIKVIKDYAGLDRVVVAKLITKGIWRNKDV